jgi:hypothetical protein
VTRAASTAATGRTVAQGGRAKAYRPIPRAQRRQALAAALAAWRRDDWFEAHELLEPAWMGTSDPIERDLYQGLIKLAAAYVHQARGNGLGMAKNLAGAQDRLARVAAAAPSAEGFDVPALLAEVERRMPGDGEGKAADLSVGPPRIPMAGPAR